MKIKEITKESFKDYGKVIEFSEQPEDPRFEVVIAEKENGWRLAVYRVIEKQFDKLEAHPYSLESFEPVSGVGLIVVSKPETPADFEVFLLDKPVCLYKGVWHQMITLSPKTYVKISENLEVQSVFYEFDRAFSCKVD